MKTALLRKHLKPLTFCPAATSIYARMSRISITGSNWKESSSKPLDFSVAAQERMPELRSHANTLVLNGIHDVEDALKKPQYKDDPRMREVAHTMTRAYDTAKAQKTQAEKK
jgi:hypothetical protein